VNTAEVFLLALNPGFSELDYTDLQNADYAEQWRRTLTFSTRTPFYFLDPAFAHTSGFQWWHRRLRELIAAVGLAAVAEKVMCLEHFPYKSVSYKPLGMTVPSQAFTFELLRDAMRCGKQMVVTRSECRSLGRIPTFV
jgi:hypothetical protein